MGNYSHLPTNAYDQAGDASGLGTPFFNRRPVVCPHPFPAYRKVANPLTFAEFLYLRNRGMLTYVEQAAGHFNAEVRLNEIYDAMFSGRNYIPIWFPCAIHYNCHQELFRYPIDPFIPAESQLYHCPIESFYPISMKFGPNSPHGRLNEMFINIPRMANNMAVTNYAGSNVTQAKNTRVPTASPTSVASPVPAMLPGMAPAAAALAANFIAVMVPTSAAPAADPIPAPVLASGPDIPKAQDISVSSIPYSGLDSRDKIIYGSVPCHNFALVKGEPPSVHEAHQGIIEDVSVYPSKKQRLSNKIGKAKNSICEFAKKVKAQYTKPYVPVRTQASEIQDYGDLLASMPIFPNAEEASCLLLYLPY
ncbi:uncharacterized protein BROUX77_006636 [Berkeleyomyces rouxiae]|uniref:uncharacterized protein n=1 Tax=Berkeleyomyces rouxiae TaxID=2035830 RepID=UPI003B7B4BD4